MSSPRLPAELLDHTVDFLHNSRGTLKSCCLVSKSWTPRARKHLFAETTFRTPRQLKSWKTMFPDPSTSPARYTTFLTIERGLLPTASDAEVGGWIRTFSRVEHFKINIGRTSNYEYFVAFHGFSPAIKSLRVNCFVFPASRILDLVLSFPLLEDLSVTTHTNIEDEQYDGKLTATQSSCSPVFSGSLQLFQMYGINRIASRLLLLPNGLRFRELDLSWMNEDDVSLTRELVEMCRSTLESVSIKNCYVGASIFRLRCLRLDQ